MMQNVDGDIGDQKPTPSQLRWRDDRKARLARMQPKVLRPPVERPAPAIVPPAPRTMLSAQRSRDDTTLLFALTCLMLAVEQKTVRVSPSARPLGFLATEYPSLSRIKQAVSEWSGISVSEMESSRRIHGVVRPRWIVIALAKRLTTKTCPEIGRGLGGKDHSTVMHAVRQIERLSAEDKTLAADLERLTSTIMERAPAEVSA